jgi:hypothetical protein
LLGGVHATDAPLQLSVAVGAKFTRARHWLLSALTTWSPGQRICGFSTSRTIIRKVQFMELLLASRAVQVTKFVPFGNADPGGGAQVTFTPEQLSPACVPNITMASQRPVAVFTNMSDGHCNAGGSKSWTVTVNWQLARLRYPSTAEHVTVVVPIAKVVPPGGKHDMFTGPQLSVAEGLKFTSASQRPAAVETTMLEGHCTTGL